MAGWDDDGVIGEEFYAKAVPMAGGEFELHLCKVGEEDVGGDVAIFVGQ